jgi:sugar phosphate isomerase/epimerase
MSPRELAIQPGMVARLFPINWRPAIKEIAIARSLGFAALQFHGQEEGLGAAHLGAPLAEVGAALRDAGLLAVMEIVVRVGADGRTRTGRMPLDVLHANLPAIGALGCERVHWHLAPATWMSGAELRAIEANAPRQLAEAVALSEAHGVRFGLEHNEPDIPLFATPSSVAAALDATPGLGLVWDLNHTPVEQIGDFLALAPRMTMLHVSDTPLPEINHHLPIGHGAVDFAACFAGLAAHGYQGPAILEIGGTPKSGGFGRDTDALLADSLARLSAILVAAAAAP